MKIEEKNFLKRKEVQEILREKAKPFFGNNRSFSCVATPRKWKSNKQKVRIENKSYMLTARAFRTISKQLRIQLED